MASERGPTRRTVLAGVAGLSAGLAGCVGSATEGPVRVLAAGSLQRTLVREFAPALSVPLEVEAHGSARAARMVADGQRDPDVLALADTALFRTLLEDPWYATFATNALVLAVNETTGAGRRVRDADRWFEPLLEDRVRLGRTDPDLDPLGYRTLFALDLAAEHYDRPGLADRLLGDGQVYPETQLLARFETGSLDAAFVYRNMAVERGYAYRDLPAAVDLSDPALADRYATVSHTFPDGTTVEGDVIRYGATLRHDRPAARTAFEAMVSSTDYLERSGFEVPPAYPRYTGAPDGVRA